MANYQLVQWSGGSRSYSGVTTKFIVKQTDEPYGSVPKTNYAFQEWLVENGYSESMANNSVSESILYRQLYNAFFGACGGGDGTLLFGVEVVRFDDDLSANDYVLRASYGGLRENGTKERMTELHIDVELEETITLDEHKVVEIHPYMRVANRIGGTVNLFSAGRWEGYVFDVNGVQVTDANRLRSAWDEEAQTITFSEPLIGTYKVVFTEEFDSWTLTIVPRVAVLDIYDPSLVYGSTVWAVASEQYYKLPIDIPDDAKDCIPYTTVVDPVTGEVITVIRPTGSATGYDVDGDGFIDGGSSIDCTCWECGGTGQLPNCVPSSEVDCTCPTCGGTGIIPGCQYWSDDDTTYNTNYHDYGGGDYQYPDDDGDPTDKPYTLKVKKHKCTNEVVSYELVKN